MEHESTRALVQEESQIFEEKFSVLEVQEDPEEVQSAEIPCDEYTEGTLVESSLISGLSKMKASPPQKLQHIRKVDSNKAVASKIEKIQKEKAPRSLLVSQKEQPFSSVQDGVQPENTVKTGLTNMIKGSSQRVSTDEHQTQTPPTTDLLSRKSVPSQDEKPKSRSHIFMTISENMYHEDGLPLGQSTRPTTDAGIHEVAVSTRRLPGSERSGAFFKVPTTVFLPDEGHQSRKPSSRVSAGASWDQENPEKADLHKGIYFP